jgi:hypothetical protein
VVIGLKVRRNQPQGSYFGLKVRSSNELSSLYCSGSGRCEARDGNLSCIFSTEKCPVIRKRGRQVEVVSNLHPNFFGLKVRHDGPQPSVFVRSFSPITTKKLLPASEKREALLVVATGQWEKQLPTHLWRLGKGALRREKPAFGSIAQRLCECLR